MEFVQQQIAFAFENMVNMASDHRVYPYGLLDHLRYATLSVDIDSNSVTEGSVDPECVCEDICDAIMNLIANKQTDECVELDVKLGYSTEEGFAVVFRTELEIDGEDEPIKITVQPEFFLSTLRDVYDS